MSLSLTACRAYALREVTFIKAVKSMPLLSKLHPSGSQAFNNPFVFRGSRKV